MKSLNPVFMYSTNVTSVINQVECDGCITYYARESWITHTNFRFECLEGSVNSEN